jgi:TolB-like protein
MKRSIPSMRQVHFGVFELDLEAGVLRRNGRKVKLQEQPFQVLAMLLERPGQVVTRDELQQRLWSTDTFVDFDHGLNKAINKIRLALGDSADAPRFVETLARRGYRFIASLPVPAKSPIRSIAVLPLQNVSGDAAQEYFSDGLTDALITNLAKIGALKVISRTSVMQYKATQKSIPIIASELGVDAVLEGTVYREGNRVRTTAQLIDVATDSHLWAENYERDLTSVLALQSQIAREVAREVHVHLTPQEASRLGDAALVNTEAYEAYLRGRSHLHKFTPDGIHAANTYFQTALELDAGSALANSALAEVFFFSMLNALVSPSEAGEKVIRMAPRALFGGCVRRIDTATDSAQTRDARDRENPLQEPLSVTVSQD